VNKAAPFLEESDIRKAVTLTQPLIDLMGDAFAAMETDEVIVPPVMQFLMSALGNQTCVKGAYLPSKEVLCLKLASSMSADGREGERTTRHAGTMLLFDAPTMALQALLADNGYLTQLRTAAAGGLCARLLAPKRIDILGVVGTGLQAELQARAACLERRPREIRVWGRTPGAASKLASQLGASTGCAAIAVSDLAELVAASQLLITATRSTSPLIEAAWVHPGLHITAMGSDAPGKVELAAGVLEKADLYVTDSVEQASLLGELAHAGKCGVDHRAINLVPLPTICAGHAIGRNDDQQITIADLTGVGVQDAAIAHYAFERLWRPQTDQEGESRK
jgi:ornithine cyclodeaminase/alanine dehydrogenase-like protein (mu-crystallin family)